MIPAVLGGRAAFDQPVRVGAPHLPKWDKVERAFRGIFERKYFANNGPLVRELDRTLATELGAAHAVCVTNGTVALTLLASAVSTAVKLHGEVLVPAFAPRSTLQAVLWAGLAPVLCDVDPVTHSLTASLVSPHITKQTVAIVAVHRWGGPADSDGLAALAAQRGIPLLFDGREAAGGKLGTFGAGTAFSLQEASVFGAGEGGFVLTDDTLVADRLRTMRNFRPSETFAPVTLRTNGKMSEAQAAMGLLCLEDLPQIIAANRVRHAAYMTSLAGIAGLTLLPAHPDSSRHAVVAAVDGQVLGIDRDELLRALLAENVVCRAPAAVAPEFPVAARLSRTLLQLPTGPAVSIADVGLLCGLIRTLAANADGVRRSLQVPA